MTEDLISKAISHTFEEIGFQNIRLSLENNFDEIPILREAIVSGRIFSDRS